MSCGSRPNARSIGPNVLKGSAAAPGGLSPNARFQEAIGLLALNWAGSQNRQLDSQMLRIYSLIGGSNSLFLEVGNFARNAHNFGISEPRLWYHAPKNCPNSLFTKELDAETGSQQTASSATC